MFIEIINDHQNRLRHCNKENGTLWFALGDIKMDLSACYLTENVAHDLGEMFNQNCGHLLDE